MCCLLSNTSFASVEGKTDWKKAHTIEVGCIDNEVEVCLSFGALGLANSYHIPKSIESGWNILRMCVESRDSGHISFADNLAFHAVKELSIRVIINAPICIEWDQHDVSRISQTKRKSGLLTWDASH